MDFSSITAAQLNAGTILPEGIVTVTLLLILVGDLIAGRQSARWLPYLAIAGLFATTGALVLGWNNSNPSGFLGAFNSDNLSI
ncbi:MAG: NAD(P)H-quinone oxidoreductase subunit 2, partial [Microcystaceae cyanobacterium]